MALAVAARCSGTVRGRNNQQERLAPRRTSTRRSKCTRARGVAASSGAVEISGQGETIPEVSAGLEAPIQLLYLGLLLVFLGGATFLVVRQVLIRRELDLAEKALGERAREGSANQEDLYELGCVLLRKRAYSQALKYLRMAQEEWQAEEGELAQVDNAAGYALLQLGRYDEASEAFSKAIKRQPAYVTALNNWGDTLEQAKQPDAALDKYQEALKYDPSNQIAQAKVRDLEVRLSRRTSQ